MREERVFEVVDLIIDESESESESRCSGIVGRVSSYVGKEEGALVRAMERGDVCAVRRLRLDGPGLGELRLVAASFVGEVEVVEEEVAWAVQVAASRGHLRTLEMLVEKDPSAARGKDALERTPLHLAAGHGHVEVVEYLVARVDVEARDARDWTALMRASYEGFVDAVELLVEKGAVINAGYGTETALDLALARGHIDIVVYLEESGARRSKFNPRDQRVGGGRTATRRRREEEEERSPSEPAVAISRSDEVSLRPQVVVVREESSSCCCEGSLESPPAAAFLEAGHVVPGGFQVVEFVGKGSRGQQVYAVVEKTSRRVLAMRRSSTMFREAVVLAELGSHECVEAMEYFAAAGGASDYFMMTRFCEGARDLERLVSSGDLYEGRVKSVRRKMSSILLDIASALSFCHDRSVLHGDVKLENVLVDAAGRAYLRNFGVARRGEGRGAGLVAVLEGGTPEYASPEATAVLSDSGRRRASSSPSETDVWAFGMVAVHVYHADEEMFPSKNARLEEPPESRWTRARADVWARKHGVASLGLDGRALFELWPNRLLECPKRKRIKLRRLLLAPSLAMRDLVLERCLARDVSLRPKCGAALVEAMMGEATRGERRTTTTTRRTEERVLLNVGRALVDLDEVCDAKRILGLSTESNSERDALLARAYLGGRRSSSCSSGGGGGGGGTLEAAVAASERALERDPTHGGALFALAEARFRRDEQDVAGFLDVLERARIEDVELSAKTANGVLESILLEADAVRDGANNEVVSVSARFRELAPKVRRNSKAVAFFGKKRRVVYRRGGVLGAALAEVFGEESEAAARAGRVVLEGDAGKTWLARALVATLCRYQRGVDVESALVPARICLASVAISEDDDDWLGRWIEEESLDARTFRAARRSRRLVLCLDGLDRVVRREKVVERARRENAAFTLVTSRPDPKNLDDLKGFVFLECGAVDDNLPLAARLETMLFRPAAAAAKRRSAAEVYGRADSAWAALAATRCEEKKARGDGVLGVARFVLVEAGAARASELFRDLALAAHEKKDAYETLCASDLGRVAPPRLAAAAWVLARSGLLPPLAARGGGTEPRIGFVHLSVQEYYVAARLGAEELFLSKIRDCRKWHAPALFAFGIADRVVRDRVLDEIRIPDLYAGEAVEVLEGEDEETRYVPRTLVALDERKKWASVKLDSWDSTRSSRLVDVSRLRRDTSSKTWALALRAASDGETEFLSGLLERGADLATPVDPVSKESTLHAAARNGRAETARALLSAGASKRAKDKTGATPLDLAFSSALSAPRRADLMRVLDPPACDRDLAAHPRRDGLVEWLEHLEEDEPIMSRRRRDEEEDDDDDWDDQTRVYAFAQACRRGFGRAAATLAASVDPNARLGASTPLHFAVANSCTEALKVLLSRRRADDYASSEEEEEEDDDDDDDDDAFSTKKKKKKKKMMKKKKKKKKKADLTSVALAATLNRAEALAILLDDESLRGGSRSLLGAAALFGAATFGSLECARVAISRGAGVDDAGGGSTALHAAASHDRVECARLLIERGADLNAVRRSDGATPLGIAASRDRVACARLLIIHGADVDKADEGGSTPLVWACRNGHVDCARVLVELGDAEVDKRTPDDAGATALHAASRYGKVECARVLISNGANLDETTTDDKGLTPLHMAAWNGHVACVEILISEGADVDALRKDKGASPLHAAALNGHVACVRLLIGGGADVKAKTHQRRTPRDVAKTREVRDILSEAEAKGDDALPPLHVASRDGRAEWLRLLIDKGADVDDEAPTNDTPLHLAARRGNLDCARVLIDEGADVDKPRCADGATPLHVACRRGHVDCARLLISAGANVDRRADDRDQKPKRPRPPRPPPPSKKKKKKKKTTTTNKPALSSSSFSSNSSNSSNYYCSRLATTDDDDDDDDEKKTTTRDGPTPLVWASRYGHVECARLLIDEGADVDKTAAVSGETPLHAASREGRAACVQLLLEKGADPNKKKKDDGSTPLLLAAEFGRAPCVRILTSRGANLGMTNFRGATPLHVACRAGRLDCARLLISAGANVDPPPNRDDDDDRDGDPSPLLLASQHDHLECVRLLIANGAEINKPTAESSPLDAASRRGHLACAKLLIDEGARVNEPRTKDGSTPLHSASVGGDFACVQLLIDKGAEVASARPDGWTPLHLAALRGAVDSLQLLIDAGADLDKPTTHDGFTPLHIASLYDRVDCVRLLIIEGADLFAQTKLSDRTPRALAKTRKLKQILSEAEDTMLREPSTPLHLASQNGHLNWLRLLLDDTKKIKYNNYKKQKTDLDQPAPDDGSTPLFLASLYGHVDCAYLLIIKGADVDKPTAIGGSTPLHVAAREGHLACVKLLLDHGAKLNKPSTDDGSTPLHLASFHGHLDCVRLLVAKGADLRAKTDHRHTPRDVANTPQVHRLLSEAQALSRTGCWCRSNLL
ncbi:hypothetical protein CTAYLR_009753 [Chrysophaeum taylorii]|uniref:Protein kinase domain-containing protein n=1 Tax=Chrysophaeum taylorii TaxID=2483200 RepID=A0AAD7UAJ5_9STRA|nr:hypothetical protein CTAYLR_009753 [Chrysophaeum taylorii]